MESATCAPPMLGSEEKPKSFFKRVMWSIFGIDLRTLALFRILISSIALYSLFFQASNVVVFFTDQGVFPRHILITNGSHPWLWSLHLLSGATDWQVFLFLVTALAHVCLLVGYRTKIATIISWIMVTSLHNRFPYLIQNGDLWMRLLLFWGIFLPLGARYSIDEALHIHPAPLPKKVLSIGTVCILIQVVLVYIFAVLTKQKQVWWWEASAVYYALNSDQFATSLVLPSMRQYNLLTKFLARSTLVFEALGPLLLLTPIGLIRTIGVLSFTAFHQGVGLFMALGPFPWVATAAVSLFLPTWFWEKIVNLIRSRRQGLATVYYDDDCGFCQKTVRLIRTLLGIPATEIKPAQSDPKIDQLMRQYGSWVVVDQAGIPQLKFAGLIALVETAPLIWLIAPLLRHKAMNALGNAFYHLGSQHRHWWSKISNMLTYRPLPLKPSFFSQLIAGLSLVSIVWWNISTVKTEAKPPEWMQSFILTLHIEQSWNMFEGALIHDGWYIMPGHLKNNTTIDIFTNSSLSWDKPPSIYRMYENERWRRFMMTLSNVEGQMYLPFYASYMCQKWNKEHSTAEQLIGFDIIFMRETTVLDHIEPPQPWYLWYQECR